MSPDFVSRRLTPMPRGNRIQRSIALVAAIASIVVHSTCIPYGSRKSTARWELQSFSHKVRISALASPRRT